MQGLWKENISGWNHKDTRRKRCTRKNILKDKGKAVYRRGEMSGTFRTSEKDFSEIYRTEGEYLRVFDIPKKEFPKEAVVYKASVKYKTHFIDDIEEYKRYDWYTKEYILDTRVVRTWFYDTKIIYVYSDNVNSIKRPNRWSVPRYNERTELKEYFSGKDVYTLLGKWGTAIYAPEIKILSQTYIKKDLDWERAREVYESYFTMEHTPYNQKKFLYNKPVTWEADLNRLWNGGSNKWAKSYVNSKDRVAIRDWLKKEDWDKEIPTHSYSKSISWLIH